MRFLLPMLFFIPLLACTSCQNQIENRLKDLEQELSHHCTTAELEAWADNIFSSHPSSPTNGEGYIVISTNEWNNAILALSKNMNGKGVEILYGKDGEPQELSALLSLRPMYSIHICTPRYSPESDFMTNVFRYRKLSDRVYLSRAVEE